MDSPLHQQRQALRQHMRCLRRSLSESQQFDASQQLAEHATLFTAIAQSQRIALFLSMDGGINTRPLIARLWHMGKSVYLPRIDPAQSSSLLFQRYYPQTQLIKHPLGMFEPEANSDELCSFTELDVVIVPLVAFDSTGQRLGMGGGFMIACWPVGKRLRSSRLAWHTIASTTINYLSKLGISHYLRLLRRINSGNGKKRGLAASSIGS